MDKKILYLECYSGISGDMTVAALLDLGADEEVLRKGLESLRVHGYTIEIGRKQKSSIDVCDFNVILDEPENAQEDFQEHLHEHSHEHGHSSEYSHEHSQEFHKHSHELHERSQESHVPPHELHERSHESHMYPHEHVYLHEHTHGDSHEPSLKSEEGLVQDHIHSHEGMENPLWLHLANHEHRNLYEILDIIDRSDITDRAKATAAKIFGIVAAAESRAHGKPIEEVHFHEVGAIDSIVDIVAAAICLDNLNIEEVVLSELHEGTGHIACQHGLLPVPVPAVINIAAEHGLPLHITSVKGELVTPTGAAIAAAIRTMDKLPLKFHVLKTGWGGGKRNYEQATGILRAMLIEDISGKESDTEDKVWVLEANLDDCSGEALSIAMELLFQNGAKDVYHTPIYMKKNRPAYMIGVICQEKDIEKLEDILFTHTTTIGIRKHEATRTILKRKIQTIATPYGDALVKVCTHRNKTFYYPECESIKKISLSTGIDYPTLYSLVQNLAIKSDKNTED